MCTSQNWRIYPISNLTLNQGEKRKESGEDHFVQVELHLGVGSEAEYLYEVASLEAEPVLIISVLDAILSSLVFWPFQRQDTFDQLMENSEPRASLGRTGPVAIPNGAILSTGSRARKSLKQDTGSGPPRPTVLLDLLFQSAL